MRTIYNVRDSSGEGVFHERLHSVLAELTFQREGDSYIWGDSRKEFPVYVEVLGGHNVRTRISIHCNGEKSRQIAEREISAVGSLVSRALNSEGLYLS